MIMLFGQKLSLMSSSVLQLTVGKISKTVQFCKVLSFYTYICNSCLRDPDSKAAKFVGMYSVSIICCVWLGLTVYQNSNIFSSPFLKITAHCVPKVQSYKLQPPRKNQSKHLPTTTTHFDGFQAGHQCASLVFPPVFIHN